jgi:hypothetical protein
LQRDTGRLSNFTFVLLNPVSNKKAAAATGSLMPKFKEPKTEE